uniref:RING-box protein 1a-like n=1 Tax=Nicotiana sylvestris TaxID=4096 RepID=A0A1U7V6P6_NICSY|nr:PREDICTED: RING-box protein 1a-like [Nicotiana sylvestris]
MELQLTYRLYSYVFASCIREYSNRICGKKVFSCLKTLQNSMASADTDVPLVPAGKGSTGVGSSTKKPKRFEIKKWNAVALWAWESISNLN